MPAAIEKHSPWLLEEIKVVSRHSAVFRFRSGDRKRGTPNPRGGGRAMPTPKTWHVTLLAEVGGPSGEGPLPWIERDYTPVSGALEWERGTCDILIKIYGDGAATSWLHERAAPLLLRQQQKQQQEQARAPPSGDDRGNNNDNNNSSVLFEPVFVGGRWQQRRRQIPSGEEIRERSHAGRSGGPDPGHHPGRGRCRSTGRARPDLPGVPGVLGDAAGISPAVRPAPSDLFGTQGDQNAVRKTRGDLCKAGTVHRVESDHLPEGLRAGVSETPGQDGTDRVANHQAGHRKRPGTNLEDL
mmetsp:Transcript_19569/g.40356  ORF Transcript_19569/g.40356 Transcript_19569/m.40356 type:complete len:298 (-) Transcript_19569:2386-3279(-)